MTINDLFALVKFCRKNGLKDWIVTQHVVGSDRDIIRIVKGEPIELINPYSGMCEPVYEKSYSIVITGKKVKVYDDFEVFVNYYGFAEAIDYWSEVHTVCEGDLED